MADYKFHKNEEDLDNELERLTRGMSEEEKNKYIDWYISAMNGEDLGEGREGINLGKSLRDVYTKITIAKAGESRDNKCSIYKQHKNRN